MTKREHLALNPKKVAGVTTEDQFKKRGEEGWCIRQLPIGRVERE